MAENRQLKNYLAAQESPIRVIYISSYIPRKCGIATFTKDLTSAVNILNPDALAEIVAISDGENEYDYPWEVKFKIKQGNQADYLACAEYINQSSADIVVLQHEFGLFGGEDGEYILELTDSINKPLVTCFHSILPQPSPKQKEILERIVQKSVASIAMSAIGEKALEDQYGAKAGQAVVIQHGVYDFSFNNTHEAKMRLGVEGEPMIMVSGLMGPGKGFDYVVDAMPSILKQNPKAKLYIIGETHPGIIQAGGERYDDLLTRKINEAGINGNVVLVNSFVELSLLIEYFKAADIYITPHLDPQQASSGTLAKAIGAGKVCISTPFNYAQEVLAEEVGILVNFKDAQSIADAVNNVMSNPDTFEKYRRNAYRLGKTMQWPRVAQRYLNLLRAVKNATFN